MSAAVIVYVKPACVQCDATKRHLIRSGIPFVEEPLTEPVLEAAKARGITTAPVVVTPGAEMWGGYKPDRLEALSGLFNVGEFDA